MKKYLSLVLVLCLMAFALPACALELLSAGDTYPLNSDKTVSWYVENNCNPHTEYADVSQSPFHQNLMKQLGVNIDWSFPTTGSDARTFTNTLLSDPSNLPDIMGIYIMSNASQYMDDEVIWDLTPYIEEYAPAYYAYLKSNPDRDQAMKDDSGRYYAFGFFREDGGWNDTYQGPVIRKDWLEECGLEIPKTISEFENVIRVFNEKYGATFTARYDLRFDWHGLAGAFGVAGNCSDNSAYMYTIRDGKVICDQTTDEWCNWATWFSKLWKEGLIDQDLLTEDDTTIKNKVYNGLCGVSLTSMGQLTNWNKDMAANGNGEPWIGIPYPTADDGTPPYIFGGRGIWDNTYVITKCADEETMKLALQMLDYAYTQEGFLFWNYGVEGESWQYDENGVPEWTALVAEDTATDPMTKYNGATWGAACIQATNLLHLKNSETAIAANDTWYYMGMPKESADMDAVLKATCSWKWPDGATFTTEEADMLDLYNSNLNTYITENAVAFLTGAKDITDDAVWEAYKKDMEKYHLNEVLEIRQACYDRFMAR